MPLLELDSKQRAELRASAHPLKPVVLIGDQGLTPSVLKEIDNNINIHGLIKVRVAGDERQTRLNILATICDELSCATVGHVGKILILYRPDSKKPIFDKKPVTEATKKSKSNAEYTPKKLAAVGKTLQQVRRRRLIKGNDDLIVKPKKSVTPKTTFGKINTTRRKVESKRGASRQNPSGFVARIGRQKQS